MSVYKNFDSEKKVVKLAGEINSATENLIKASNSLISSYNYSKGCKELIGIRTNITNCAIVYCYKIMPFSSTTIRNIQSFCSNCIYDSYEEFKSMLMFVQNEAESNVIFCGLTLLFNNKILIEFKKIEMKASKLKEGSKLGRKYHEVVNGHLGRGNQTTSETNRNFETMQDLENSIKCYVAALSEIAGFFNSLYADLKTMQEYIKRDDFDIYGKTYHTIINRCANEISDACKQYTRNEVIYSSNIGALLEYQNEKYVKRWAQNAINGERVVKIRERYKELIKDGPDNDNQSEEKSICCKIT